MGQPDNKKDNTPLKIAGLYACAGALWILFSDRILAAYVRDSTMLSQFQTYKGWFFILATALMLYFLVRHYLSDIQHEKSSLEESERDNRMLFELSPMGLALCRMDGKLVRVNNAYAAIIGRTVEETLNLTYWEITPERFRDKEEEQLKKLRETGSYGPYEKEYIHKNGHLVPVQLSGLIVHREEGEFIWSSVEDITERLQAVEALRNSQEKFMRAFHATPDSISISRAVDGLLLEVNDVFLQQTGYSRTEALGKTTRELKLWDNPSDRDVFLSTAKEQGRVREMEARFRIKSGKILDCLVSGELFRLNGELYLLTVVRDISERKAVEEELNKHRLHLEEMVEERTAKLQERTSDLEKSQTALRFLLEDVNEAKEHLEAANIKLRELDRLKSMFIASMSHELRTPLNSIIGFSGIMLQGMTGSLNDEQQDQLARVFRAGKHLLGLITDVIDIAKIESGRIVPFSEDFQLDKLIDEAIGQVRQPATEKNIAIEQKIPEDLISLHTDRRRLLQCLLNYLSNSVKFSEHGTITIEVSEVKEAKNIAGDLVEISVRDNGIGIREEDMKLLFGSFVRLETPLKTITPGTGLGLYLTKKLATEVLEGEVGVESKDGEGSRFWIRIPVVLRTAMSHNEI